MNQTDFVNLTLAHLGQEDVADITSSNSNAGRKVLRFLTGARNAVLRSHGWLAALRYVSLTVSPNYAASFKHAYVYELPEDALKVWEVDDACEAWEAGTATNSEGASRMVVRSNNSGPLALSYVRALAWEAFDQALADAVCLECAARASRPVTGDEMLARSLEARARDALIRARSAEALEAGNDAELAGDTALTGDPFAAIRRSVA